MSYPPQPPYPPVSGPPGPPDDPWGTARVPPVSGAPVTGASGPLPPPPYGPPPVKKRANTTLIAAIVGAAVVLVVGCCTGLYIIGSQEDPNTALPGVTSTAGLVQSEPAATSEAAVPTLPSPTAGEPSPSGTPVKTVTMPKVTGENAAVADDKLRKLGFTNIQYGSQDEKDKVVLLLTNWTVAKQSAKAGGKVSTDTLIVLTCTKQS
jgi:hypothetical protein